MKKTIVKKDTALKIPTFNEAQKRILEQRTPPKYIKNRVGRGGKKFDYVEVGYVVQQLNQAFSFMWDFEVADQGIGKDQVWVKGMLRVWIRPDFSIVKSAFGGAEIKKWDKRWDNASKSWVDHDKKGQAIDIGDDLKAAAADALKKGASLLGVAGDIYYPQMDRLEQEVAPVEEIQPVEPSQTPASSIPFGPQSGGYSDNYATPPQKAKIFAMAKEYGVEAEEVKEKVKLYYKLKSFNDLTKAQASEYIERYMQTMSANTKTY